MTLRILSRVFLFLTIFHFIACSTKQIRSDYSNAGQASNPLVLDVKIKVGNKFKNKIKNGQYMIWSINDVSTGDMVAVGLVEKPKFPMNLKLYQDQLLSKPVQKAPLAMSVRLVSKKNIFTPPAKGQLVGYLGGIRDKSEKNSEGAIITLSPAAKKRVEPFKVDRLFMGDSASLEINRTVL